MKVLHITNNYPTHKYPIFGIFVKEQIESLAAQNIENEVFFINGREKGKFEYLKTILRLRKILKYKQFDVIHCHHVLSAVCLILSGRSKTSKMIVSFQSDPANELGHRLYAYIKKNANAIILKNNSPLINNKNVFYFPNGVNTSFFKPLDKKEACRKLKLDASKKYILFVSSNYIRKEKRYDRFHATISILKEKHHNIEELILTNTRRELIPLYFNAADIHLLTSDFEGSPNSVKEAMACNTSVVSTDVGSVKELLENVKGSFVSSSDDSKELARLVEIALNSKEQNGREKIIQLELDIDCVAKKLKEIYLKVLKNN
jgi:teichuronic acid biosynthesis glycosyltransferase TuaC